MPLTIANVTHPNQSISEFQLGPWKARLIDVTFDSSYLTTGEVLTAAQLGWVQIHGAIVVELGSNRGSTGTLALDVNVRANAARTQVTVQAYETAGTVDTPHKEVTSAQDISAYTCRLLVFGS